MKFDGRYFQLELLMKAPIWLLIFILVLVTVAVIATSVGVF